MLFVGNFLFFKGVSQQTFPVNGTVNPNHNYHAFTNATIYSDYKTAIEDATLLIQDNKIVAVGKEVVTPKGAIIHDLKGKYIYPSFIDLDSQYGIEKSKKEKAEKGVAYISNRKGAFGWNEAIKSDQKAVTLFNVNAKQAKELRKLGFGAVLTHQHDGIVRGTGALVSLGEAPNQEMILAPEISAHFSFSKGTSRQSYPSSQMGSIALLRQTYLDADWYEKIGNKEEKNLSLQQFNALKKYPILFETNDYLRALRADKIGDEFGVQYIFKGGGDEYKRIAAIKKTNAAFVVPINYPKAYDIADPYEALLIPLKKMKHWEMAPANLSMLQKSEVEFAITARGTDSKDFFNNIQLAIKNGLSQEAALRALTYTPAKLINMQTEIGTLKKGYYANFFITDKPVFEKGSTILDNWISGEEYDVSADVTKLDIRGDYELKIADKAYQLYIKGKPGKQTITISRKDDSTEIKGAVNIEEQLISMSFQFGDTTAERLMTLSGKMEDLPTPSFSGRGQQGNGEWINWSAKQIKGFETKKDTSKPVEVVEVGQVLFPNMAYGFKELPKPEAVLIKNATVWTNEDEGILENATVLIENGKIAYVGSNPPVTNAEVIDAKGKHITAGIVDEHSHIAISSGVNEATQAVTAEVSIADVINPDDVNIYRQLAGGVTSVQLLHGSANPIGGQSALIKLRWGKSAEEMKIQNADGFIKFALGENVKRSNWGDKSRFPQSRMGVEQVFYDAFYRAKEYDKKQRLYQGLVQKRKPEAIPPRKDLELEVLLEILNKKRFITCHSYVQSEINMLMHVADSMGFTVNTFTHILEGYKVAEKMKAHGVAGSTFSDWWAYKYEVNDAIPYNGALLHQQGVLTGFNSDDAEMARRLNQEAAKAVKYGGVNEEEALKFVTLNPAKMLHLDDRIGSIKVGKDADIVLWSDHPLSVYTKAEKTFIDGICYYDINRDKQLRDELEKERYRLIDKMITAKKNGAATQKIKGKKQKLYHCDTVEEEY